MAVQTLGDDVSPDFVPNATDAAFTRGLLMFEGTPLAIEYFAAHCHRLTDYGYWYCLGTLWVSFSGWSNLYRWKRLLASPRPKRKTSLMKPSEMAVFDALPEQITAYRAHRQGERDWISYTLSRYIAERFARQREVNEITEYQLRKRDIIALFLRRAEDEVIMLRPGRAAKIAVHPLTEA